MRMTSDEHSARRDREFRNLEILAMAQTRQRSSFELAREKAAECGMPRVAR
jgi:hypothetical protein